MALFCNFRLTKRIDLDYLLLTVRRNSDCCHISGYILAAALVAAYVVGWGSVSSR